MFLSHLPQLSIQSIVAASSFFQLLAQALHLQSSLLQVLLQLPLSFLEAALLNWELAFLILILTFQVLQLFFQHSHCFHQLLKLCLLFISLRVVLLDDFRPLRVKASKSLSYLRFRLDFLILKKSLQIFALFLAITIFLTQLLFLNSKFFFVFLKPINLLLFSSQFSDILFNFYIHFFLPFRLNL